jgi:integral membrane protein (TIGR01906 family)
VPVYLRSILRLTFLLSEYYNNDVNMKFVSFITRYLFILCIPFLLISAGIAWCANSLWLYQYGFQKYDVSAATGLTSDQLKFIGKEFIHYFNSGEEYINIIITEDSTSFSLFTEEETVHFKDVKSLIRLDYTVLAASLAYFLLYIAVYLARRKESFGIFLARNITWGCGLTLFLMLMIGIGTLLDFDRLWLQFHFLAFTNDFWSASGYMLLLFPEEFWYTEVTITAIFVVSLAFIMGISSIAFIKLRRKRIQSSH